MTSAVKKIKPGKEWRWTFLQAVQAFLNTFSAKMIIVQRHEGDKEMSCMAIWRKNIPGNGNIKCKDPESSTCLDFWRKTKETSVT